MKNATDFREVSFFNLDHLKWLYLSSEGRVNRMRYWGAVFLLAPFVIVWFVVSSALIAAGSFGAVIGGILFAIGYVVLLVTSLMLLIKRAHDRDHSGWYLLMTMIPLLGLAVSIELYFFAGTYGGNQYGRDPKPLDER